MPVIAVETSMGTFTLELYDQHAPKTCENFIGLVKQKYYDDTIVHRVIPDFMVQMGDPTGTGRGGNSIWGSEFEDEISDLKHTGAGSTY
jgi:peptidyl-prolyl cis-trans isomerase-like 1